MIDCNHDCSNCPAHVLYGGNPTSCIIMNKILSRLEWDKLTSRELYNNAIKEGEKLEKES